MLASHSVHTLAHAEGNSYWFLGSLMTLKASAETTQGAFSLIEQVAPVGFAPPLHIHHAEDEAFYILEGEITFFVGDQALPEVSGSYIYLPRDIPHAFYVGGSSPARLLQWTFPAGLEKFFVELGITTQDLVLPIPDSPQQMQMAIQRLMETAPKYHLEIVGPPPGMGSK